jgi:hypothetical protein
MGTCLPNRCQEIKFSAFILYSENVLTKQFPSNCHIRHNRNTLLLSDFMVQKSSAFRIYVFIPLLQGLPRSRGPSGLYCRIHTLFCHDDLPRRVSVHLFHFVLNVHFWFLPHTISTGVVQPSTASNSTQVFHLISLYSTCFLHNVSKSHFYTAKLFTLRN